MTQMEHLISALCTILCAKSLVSISSTMITILTQGSCQPSGCAEELPLFFAKMLLFNKYYVRLKI